MAIIDLLDSAFHKFDNAVSGLTADKTKTAIDELAADVATNNAKTSNIQSDLSYTASTGVVANSDGTGFTIPLATTSVRGLMTDAQFDQLALTTGTNSGDNATNSLYSGLVSNIQSDLSYTAATGVVSNSDGTGFTITLATTLAPGLMTSSQFDQLALTTGTNSGDNATNSLYSGLVSNIQSDLSYTATTRVVSNSDGTGFTIPEVIPAGNSGLLTGSDKTKLDAISGTNTGDSQTLAAGVSDVTATAAEVNLLDLSGLTVDWVLSADSATTASWKAPADGNVPTVLSEGTRTATTYGITSDGSADDLILPAANTTQAGLMTDAQFDKLALTTGTNSGDQTSIVNLTGTKAQFNTELSDGSFAFSGGAFHDGFSDYVAEEHIRWDLTNAANIHADNYTDTTYINSDFDHDQLTNYDISQHRIINDAGTSSTELWSASKVDSAINAAVASSVTHKGGYNAATDTPSLDDGTPIAGILQGDMYAVTVAGDFFSASDPLEVGDVLIADQDSPTTVAHWTIVNKNLDATSIKTSYESNTDTNAYTDAEKTKVSNLSGTNSGDSQTLSAGVSDVTATAAELNLLDLSGLTADWVLSADTATTASWKAPTGGGGVALGDSPTWTGTHTWTQDATFTGSISSGGVTITEGLNSQLALIANDASDTTIRMDTTTGATDRIRINNAAGALEFVLQNTSTALTLDTSLNATFAGTVNVNSGDTAITPQTWVDDLVVEKAGDGGISILTPNTNQGALAFGDPENAYAGQIAYSHSTNSMILKVDAGTALTLDSAQNATFAGKLIVPDYIEHAGDSDTYFGFWGADSWKLRTGGTDALVVDASQNATFAGIINSRQDVASGYAYNWIENTNVNGYARLRLSGNLAAAQSNLYIDHAPGVFSRLLNDSTDPMQFAPNSTVALTLDSSQNATFGGKITSGNDIVNASAGVYTWAGDTDTYIQLSAPNEITFKTAAVTALILDTSQNATFAGAVTATTFSGSGASLTNLPASSNNTYAEHDTNATFTNRSEGRLIHHAWSTTTRTITIGAGHHLGQTIEFSRTGGVTGATTISGATMYHPDGSGSSATSHTLTGPGRVTMICYNGTNWMITSVTSNA